MGSSNPLSRVDLEATSNSVENRWVVNDEQTRERSEVGDYLSTKGTELENNGSIEIEDERVQPGSEINTTVRYEESATGNQILIRMEWNDETDK